MNKTHCGIGGLNHSMDGLQFKAVRPRVSARWALSALRLHRSCRVEDVHRYAKPLKELSNAQLREETTSLRIEQTRIPHLTLLAKSSALIYEAIRRKLGKTLYDVQLQGGLALAQGKIAQMQTGEGKTLTTAVPAMYFALSGRGVHVATTNAYLAERDCEELKPVFESIGLSVGLLEEEADNEAKRLAYACDITFGTGYEFGFDYLRDQLAMRNHGALPLGVEHLQSLMGYSRPDLQPVQRDHAYAIVDEADSVLIDEATMPLILSSAAGAPPKPFLYGLALDTANVLDLDEHYEIETAEQKLTFTQTGWEKLHAVLNEHPTLPLDRAWSTYVENALRAKLFLLRDVNYVVLDDKVQIVDQHTGRIHEERTWRDGLHQAIEMKERVELTAESSSDARVSRQRYFQLYDKVCGMTGTANGIEAELYDFYRLRTEVIPTHRPSQREYWPLRSFASNESRNRVVVTEIQRVQQTGRPVLVATRTIAHSLELSELLTACGIEHQVLNGVQDEDEAQVVSTAGQARSVMIATNMAGRGTDIRLDPTALAAGGLHVIAAEHNQSPRVDRQIVGRAARQGNPGSCQFFISAEDELLKHDESLTERIRTNANEDGEYTNNVSVEIERIQQRLEKRQYEQRRSMVARDSWLDDVLKTLASPQPLGGR